MNGGSNQPPSCFSCDSYLKEGNKGSIEYNREKKEKIVYINTAPFCLKCLNKPDEIDIDGIIENLTEKGYLKTQKIKLLRKALENFKEGKMQKKIDTDGTIIYYLKERS